MSFCCCCFVIPYCGLYFFLFVFVFFLSWFFMSSYSLLRGNWVCCTDLLVQGKAFSPHWKKSVNIASWSYVNHVTQMCISVPSDRLLKSTFEQTNCKMHYPCQVTYGVQSHGQSKNDGVTEGATKARVLGPSFCWRKRVLPEQFCLWQAVSLCAHHTDCVHYKDLLDG